MRKAIALAAGVLVLAVANWTILQREELLRDGRVAILELAPVDPRSLMQGDYMALRFKVAVEALDRAKMAKAPAGGHVVVKLGANALATFTRLDDGSVLAPDELRMVYRIRGGQLKFATNAYFFQEGDGPLYATARYGEFRVARNGDSILVALRDRDLKRLGPPAGAGVSGPPAPPSGPRSSPPRGG